MLETRVNVKQVLGVEVVSVTSTNKSRVWVFGFEYEVIGADMVKKFRLLSAPWGTVEGAHNDRFYLASWVFRFH